MKVTIIGAGAYALALANNINKTNSITIWTKFEEEKIMLENVHENTRVLPGIKLDSQIEITTDLKEALTDSKLIIIAVPAAFVNDISVSLKKIITDKQYICIASKGIEQKTCLFVYDIFTKHVKTNKVAIISGPTFAIDMAKKVPTGLSLATKNKLTGQVIKEALSNENIKFRVTKDVVGTEICGSIKNVVALAAGILNGMGYPESTQAMFVTESLHDIKGLLKALGGNPKTILSYAGFGDLLLTATSVKSRNYQFGQMIGRKMDKEKIEEYKNTTTIEGLYTLKSIYKLLKNKKVDIPIINIIYDIIYKEKSIEQLPIFLMTK